jgi:hypothetical protein
MRVRKRDLPMRAHMPRDVLMRAKRPNACTKILLLRAKRSERDLLLRLKRPNACKLGQT